MGETPDAGPARSRRLSLAAGVVATLQLAGCSADGDGPLAAPSEPTTAASDPEREREPDRTTARAWVDGLPTGRSPRIAYQVGLTLVAPDGTERRSAYPNPLYAFARYQGGLLGTDLPYGAQSHLVLDRSLRRIDGGCTVGPPALSADGTQVFWSTGACQESIDPPAVGTITAGSVDGSQGPVSEEILRSEGQGIRVLGPLTGGDGLGGPVAYQLFGSGGSGPVTGVWTTDLDGSFAQIPSLQIGLATSTTGLIAGENGGWFSVRDVEAQQVLWRERARFDAADFSPDGRHLLLDETVREARTGEVITELDPVDPLTSLVWEDDGHLLVGVQGRRGEAAVVRYDLEGNAEVAVPWRAGPRIGFEVLP